MRGEGESLAYFAPIIRRRGGRAKGENTRATWFMRGGHMGVGVAVCAANTEY